MKKIFGDLLNHYFPFHYTLQPLTGGNAGNKKKKPQQKSKTESSNSNSLYHSRPSVSCADLNIRVATAALRYQLCGAKTGAMFAEYVQGVMGKGEDKGTTGSNSKCDVASYCELVVQLNDHLLLLNESNHDTSSTSTSNARCKTVRKKADSTTDSSGTDEHSSGSQSEQIVNKLVYSCYETYKEYHPLKRERRHLLNMLLALTDADHKNLHRCV